MGCTVCNENIWARIQCHKMPVTSDKCPYNSQNKINIDNTLYHIESARDIESTH